MKYLALCSHQGPIDYESGEFVRANKVSIIFGASVRSVTGMIIDSYHCLSRTCYCISPKITCLHFPAVTAAPVKSESAFRHLDGLLIAPQGPTVAAACPAGHDAECARRRNALLDCLERRFLPVDTASAAEVRLMGCITTQYPFTAAACWGSNAAVLRHVRQLLAELEAKDWRSEGAQGT